VRFVSWPWIKDTFVVDLKEMLFVSFVDTVWSRWYNDEATSQWWFAENSEKCKFLTIFCKLMQVAKYFSDCTFKRWPFYAYAMLLEKICKCIVETYLCWRSKYHTKVAGNTDVYLVQQFFHKLQIPKWVEWGCIRKMLPFLTQFSVQLFGRRARRFDLFDCVRRLKEYLCGGYLHV
jgi:hypothetical protein